MHPVNYGAPRGALPKGHTGRKGEGHSAPSGSRSVEPRVSIPVAFKWSQFFPAEGKGISS